MNVLIIARCDGWMGIHIQHFANGFRQLEHDVTICDRRQFDHQQRFPWLFRRDNPEEKRAIRTAKFTAFLKQKPPDLVILCLAHLRFDLTALKKSFSGPLVVYDLDGPVASYYEEDLHWLTEIDHLFTVSQIKQRQLHANPAVHYLPHGVDTDYYQPLTLNQTQQQRFHAPLAFIGRPSERRQALLQEIATDGLVLWGRRWSARPYRNHATLKQCVREKNDIVDDELVYLYNASNVVVNILRDPRLCTEPTILNLQAFAVPAAGVCVLTEWVEELEQAFKPDKELLVFKGAEELKEKAKYYAKNQTLARKIGHAGRARCLAEHTHTHRAKQMLHIIAMNSDI